MTVSGKVKEKTDTHGYIYTIETTKTMWRPSTFFSRKVTCATVRYQRSSRFEEICEEL